MKKLFLNAFAITALFALMSNACDDLKEKLNLTIPLNIEKTYTVKYNPETDGGDNIFKEDVVEPGEDVAKYLGKIEEITLEGISVKIKENANHAPGSYSGLAFGYRFTEGSSYQPENVFTIENSSNGSYTKLNLTQAQLQEVADHLKGGNNLYIVYQGVATGNVDLDISVLIEGEFDALN